MEFFKVTADIFPAENPKGVFALTMFGETVKAAIGKINHEAQGALVKVTKVSPHADTTLG